MAYVLAPERVELEIPEGPSVEVTRIVAWPIYWAALRRMSAFLAAKKPDEELVALHALYELVVAEAQPTFSVIDHRGVVPCTVEGLLRLPVMEIGVAWATQWLGLWDAAKPETAVDAVIEPGPARDELNRRLRAARKTA